METNNNQTFTKFPNELLEHIMCSKLNASEIKILLCVVRYTYGFHREQHELSQSFIQNATDLSENYSKKVIQNLIKKDILIETKKYTATSPRWLAINPNFDVVSRPNNNLTKTKENQNKTENNPSAKSENPSETENNPDDNTINLIRGILYHTSSGTELEPTTGIELNACSGALENTQERNIKKKVLKKEVKESSRVDTSVNRENIKPFNINILKTQIAQQYLSIFTENNTYPFTLEEVVDIFVFYYEEYKKHMNTDHPILSNKNIKKIIEELPLCDDISDNGYIELFPDFYPDMIKKHFETSYQNCDYNILHFISGSIRALRYYETIYE